MARKRQRRKNNGLFDVPDGRHDGDDGADNGRSAGVFGGPTHDSRLLGGPGHNSGLLDAPDRAPGDMPGLFDRPGGGAGSGRDLFTLHAVGSVMIGGLFVLPRRGR